MSVCVFFRYTWCLSCGRLVSVWIMVNSETTAILETPTSLRQSEEGKNSSTRSKLHVLYVREGKICKYAYKSLKPIE